MAETKALFTCHPFKTWLCEQHFPNYRHFTLLTSAGTTLPTWLYTLPAWHSLGVKRVCRKPIANAARVKTWLSLVHYPLTQERIIYTTEPPLGNPGVQGRGGILLTVDATSIKFFMWLGMSLSKAALGKVTVKSTLSKIPNVASPIKISPLPVGR